MLSRIRLASRFLGTIGSIVRPALPKAQSGSRSKVATIGVTLFRLVLVLPGARLDRHDRP